MISIIAYDDLSVLCNAETVAQKIQKLHLQFTEARLMEALIARFGELPSNEDIAAHCLKVIDPDHTTHYVWFDGEKPKLGEKPDMSGLLCSIAPPKIFTNPEN
jgi:DNA-binding response OmpR family regulator